MFNRLRQIFKRGDPPIAPLHVSASDHLITSRHTVPRSPSSQQSHQSPASCKSHHSSASNKNTAQSPSTAARKGASNKPPRPPSPAISKVLSFQIRDTDSQKFRSQQSLEFITTDIPKRRYSDSENTCINTVEPSFPRNPNQSNPQKTERSKSTHATLHQENLQKSPQNALPRPSTTPPIPLNHPKTSYKKHSSLRNPPSTNPSRKNSIHNSSINEMEDTSIPSLPPRDPPPQPPPVMDKEFYKAMIEKERAEAMAEVRAEIQTEMNTYLNRIQTVQERNRTLESENFALKSVRVNTHDPATQAYYKSQYGASQPIPATVKEVLQKAKIQLKQDEQGIASGATSPHAFRSKSPTKNWDQETAINDFENYQTIVNNHMGKAVVMALTDPAVVPDYEQKARKIKHELLAVANIDTAIAMKEKKSIAAIRERGLRTTRLTTADPVPVIPLIAVNPKIKYDSSDRRKEIMMFKKQLTQDYDKKLTTNSDPEHWHDYFTDVKKIVEKNSLNESETEDLFICRMAQEMKKAYDSFNIASKGKPIEAMTDFVITYAHSTSSTKAKHKFYNFTFTEKNFEKEWPVLMTIAHAAFNGKNKDIIHQEIKALIFKSLPVDYREIVLEEELLRQELEENGTPVPELKGDELKNFILKTAQQRKFFQGKLKPSYVAVTTERRSQSAHAAVSTASSDYQDHNDPTSWYYDPDLVQGHQSQVAVQPIQASHDQQQQRVATLSTQQGNEQTSGWNGNQATNSSAWNPPPSWDYNSQMPMIHINPVIHQSPYQPPPYDPPNSNSNQPNKGHPKASQPQASNSNQSSSNQKFRLKDIPWEMVGFSEPNKIQTCAENIAKRYEEGVPKTMDSFMENYRNYSASINKPTVVKVNDPHQKPKIVAYQGGYLLQTPPIPENVFKKKTTRHTYFTNDLLEYFTLHCFKCGFRDCNPASEHCPYAKAADSYNPCIKCHRALHLTKDCKWMGTDPNHARERSSQNKNI